MSETEPETKLKNNFCPKCSFSTAYKAVLKRHVQRMHIKKQEPKAVIKLIHCPKCKYSTYLARNLHAHYTNNHHNEKILSCSVCSYKSAYLKAFNRHIRLNKHQDNKLSCTLCNFTTNLKSEFLWHTRTHLNVINTSNTTPKNSEINSQNSNFEFESLITKECMDIKVNMANENADEYKVLAEENELKSIISDTKSKFKLPRNELFTTIKEEIKDIENDIYKISEDDLKCKTYITESEFKSLANEIFIPVKEEIQENKKEKSEENSKSYAISKKRLKKQIPRKYYHFCSECDYGARTTIRLINHMRVKHNMEISPVNCLKCPYITLSPEALVRHNAEKHTPKEFKTLKCAECDYSTFYKSYLRRHVKSHSKTQFKCNLCSYTATGNSRNMQVHFMSKHAICRRNYVCRVCNFKTINVWRLRTHQILTHCPLTSPIEHKVEKMEPLFENVKKETIGEHACPHCDYATKFKCTLHKHILLNHPSDKSNSKTNQIAVSSSIKSETLMKVENFVDNSIPEEIKHTIVKLKQEITE